MVLAQPKTTQFNSLEYEFVNHADFKTLELQVYGQIHVCTFLDMIEQVNKELHQRKYRNLIYHSMRADPSSMTTDDLKETVSGTNAFNQTLEGGRLAAVVDNKLSFGMFRMWHAFSSSDMTYEFEIFTKYQLAESWVRQNN